MANGRFTLGKQSGGTLGLVFPDGVSDTEVQRSIARTFIRENEDV